jgi:DNA polymerase-1
VASTRDEDLEVLAERHPLPARVRDYRVLAKLRSTYVDALQALVNPETGRVHTSFHPTGAVTGRLSSSDPNLQNIPVRTAEGRKIRAAFVPQEGWSLVSADYSQVELRVMAHQSADPDLIATFERGEDIHRLTAARIYNVPYASVTGDQRRAAKTINFGILYGMGPQRLARDLGITMGEAKELIASYFGRFPKIRAYIDGTIARAERDGFVSTLFGRVRRFPELSSTSRFQRQLAVRQAVNSTIQGTAADLMKIAMVRLHRLLRERGLAARLLIQVHDELVLESPTVELPALEEVIREAMETIPPFTVPLTVDIASGTDWLAAKP